MNQRTLDLANNTMKENKKILTNNQRVFEEIKASEKNQSQGIRWKLSHEQDLVNEDIIRVIKMKTKLVRNRQYLRTVKQVEKSG